MHWHTHKKFCKQLAKDYEEQLAAKLEEERLEETNNVKEESSGQMNGDNQEQSLTCVHSETNNESKTTSHQLEDVSESKPESNDEQSSGAPEERA